MSRIALGEISSDEYVNLFEQMLAELGMATILPTNQGGLGQDVSSKTGVVAFEGGTAYFKTGTNYDLLERLASEDGDVRFIALAAKLFQLATTKGDLIVSTGATTQRKAVGTDGYVLSADSTQPDGLAWVPTLGGQRYGLLISNNGTDAVNDLDIAAGFADDSTNTVRLMIASAMTKKLDAAWESGTNKGGLSSSLSPANTTYHIFLIRTASVSTDIGFDTSPVAANLIADHSVTYFRRIGSWLRESNTFVPLIYYGGGRVKRVTPLVTIDTLNPGTGAVTRTMAVPTGISVLADLVLRTGGNANGAIAAYLSDLSQADLAADPGIAQVTSGFVSGGTRYSSAPVLVRTNTSGQIRSRISASDAGSALTIADHGWIDLGIL